LFHGTSVQRDFLRHGDGSDVIQRYLFLINQVLSARQNFFI
jgi:hypothetical protein